MLTGRAIICMSTIDWNFSWQPNQEIMYRLAQSGNRILYIETTGARTVRASDWRRLLARFRSALGARPPLQRTHPNLMIYSPLVLPFPHLAPAHAVNKTVISRTVDGWRRRTARDDVIFWAFLASPLTLALIDHLRPTVVVYQCMGDATASRPIPEIARAEQVLLRRCDLAFANSLRLLDHVRQFTPRAHLFRAGADVEAFERAAAAATDPPPELAGMSGPVVGYIGSIHQWVDLALLAEVAGRLLGWQFVMIGPVLRDVSGLRRLSNLHWLGARPHHELPRYMRHFAVGMIPYVLDSYTASAYPGKLNEYLALGIPVVATPLPELEAYNQEFGDVVSLAGGGEAFADAIRRAAEAATESRRAQYREAARQNSWQRILDQMSALIETVAATRTHR